MPGFRPGPRIALILCVAALTAACGQRARAPGAASPTPPSQPPAAATATPQLEPSPAPATPTPLAGTPIQPRTDPTPGAPVEIARSALAARLGVMNDLVTVVSEGEWTADPIACELDLPAGSERLIQGRHKQVMLTVKDRTYEVWVFESVGGVPLAFPCSAP